MIGPLFPSVKSTGRPPVDRRTVVEATAWRFRTGAPWRDVPERFGNWNTIYKNFNRFSEQGVWARVLERTQSLAQQSGDLDWVASIDSTIVRVHQHGATLPRATGGSVELQEVRTGAARSRDRPLPRRADDEEPPGLRREGTRTRVHPHARASSGHQHARRDVERDPRLRRERQAEVKTGPSARGQGLPVQGEPGLAT